MEFEAELNQTLRRARQRAMRLDAHGKAIDQRLKRFERADRLGVVATGMFGVATLLSNANHLVAAGNTLAVATSAAFIFKVGACCQVEQFRRARHVVAEQAASVYVQAQLTPSRWLVQDLNDHNVELLQAVQHNRLQSTTQGTQET